MLLFTYDNLQKKSFLLVPFVFDLSETSVLTMMFIIFGSKLFMFY